MEGNSRIVLSKFDMRQNRHLPIQTRRDAWVEINLSALESNIREIRRLIPGSADIMAIVKADAYGHGASMIIPTLEAFGVSMVGVAAMDEAIQIRHAGIELPILVIGAIPDWAMQVAVDYDIQLTVFAEHHLESLRRVYGITGQPIKAHIKVDTGMHRIGIDWRNAVPFIRQCLRSPYIQVEGLFTHLACAEAPEFTHLQRRRFKDILDTLQAEEGSLPPYLHLANTVGSLAYVFPEYNLVRIGIGIFGYDGGGVAPLKLQPVLGLKGRIIHLQEVPKGEGISYGQTYIAERDLLIATVPIGYADGVPRRLSNRIHGLFQGQKVPQVGMITMDQMMFDVTGVSPVSIGEAVTLIGRDDYSGNSRLEITLSDWAAAADTIEYELMCALRVRLPKTYTRQ